MAGPGRGRNGTLLVAGLVLLWVSALLSLPMESGDCAGSIEACGAAAIVAQGHVRLLMAVVLLITVLVVGALRAGYRMTHVALVASSAALVVLGIWVAAAQNQRPEWLPVGFMFTIPAALLLAVGAARQLRGSRSVGRGRI